MKTKCFKTVVLPLLLMVGCVSLSSCSSDDDLSAQVKLSDLLDIPFDQDEEITDITDVTWKLYGYGDSATGLIRKSKSLEYNRMNIITFSKDGTLSGHSTSNELFGEYTISGFNIDIFTFGGTKVGEVSYLDGYEFCESFRLCKKFEITNNWLKLYYNEGKNLLLFKVLK